MCEKIAQSSPLQAIKKQLKCKLKHLCKYKVSTLSNRIESWLVINLFIWKVIKASATLGMNLTLTHI